MQKPGDAISLGKNWSNLDARTWARQLLQTIILHCQGILYC